MKSHDPNIRKQAKLAGEKIRGEMHDKKIARMRARVVEETRKSKSGNANDIREDIQNHVKRGFGPTSFTINWGDRYEEIFGKK